MTPNRVIRKFLQLYAETFTKTFIQKPISKRYMILGDGRTVRKSPERKARVNND